LSNVDFEQYEEFDYSPYNDSDGAPCLSDKFLRSRDKRINILHGSVRSSKSIASLLKFLGAMMSISDEQHNVILGAYSHKTLRNNLIDPLFSIVKRFRLDELVDFDYERETHIKWNRNKIVLIGFNNDSALGRVQGLTAKYMLIDELGLIPEEPFNMAYTRLSERDACFWATMNPTNPNHWIYRKWIHNTNLDSLMNVWNYQLWDNPHLPSEYVDSLLATYPKGSVEYKRYILGEPVAEEGLIYDNFNSDEHLFQYNNNDDMVFDEYYISTDYGPGSVSCALLTGLKREHDGNIFYVLDEYYYDIKEHNGHGLSDEELSDKIAELAATIDKKITKFYLPHDATSLYNNIKSSLKYIFYKRLKIYKPDTLADISVIKDLFYKNKILINTECENLIRGLESYRWDPKATMRGESRPLKVDDHLVDSLRAPIIDNYRGRKNYEALTWGG
jgi:PBSX family phage terminase large subunit